MTKQLATQDVTLSTATVEVRTLTLGRKQVTLAVFRQLPEAPLVAEDGTLNGEAWGWVNYCPDRTCGTGGGDNHRHIVWQRDGELRRSRVEDRALHGNSYWLAEADAFISAHAHEVLDGRGRYWEGRLPTGNGRGEIYFKVSGVSLGAEIPDKLSRAASAWQAWAETAEMAGKCPDQEWRAWDVASYRERLDELLMELGPAPSPEEVDVLHAALLAAVGIEKERRQRHVGVRRALWGLPQLFIAV